MKTKTKKALIIIIVVLFFIGVVLSMPFLSFTINNSKQLIDNQLSVTGTIKEIRNNTGYRDYYKNKKKDVVSLYYRVTKKDVVTVNNSQVVLSKEGYLVEPVNKASDEDVENYCKNINELKKCSNENGANFLYVYAPDKPQFVTYPNGVDNYSVQNYELFINNLKNLNVETLDLSKEMEKEDKALNDMFFITDHHWKPEAGFWATGKICQKLSENYGFNYNLNTTDINNYNIKTYKNWFLGSTGKSVGKYYSPLGVDDYLLFTPKFDTDITETRPFENETKSGDFSNTLIESSRIKYKNLYFYNTYAAYTGGDYRLQITVNNKAENDDIILVIRDSFACVVTPFLTLNCKEVHSIDIRNYEYLGKDKIDLKSYIETVNPDYVIVLYHSVPTQDNSGKYEFLE